MNETHPANQTDAPEDAAARDDSDVLRKADAWQVKGVSVWDTVKVQVAAELPEPSPFRADALQQSIYETHAGDESAEAAARFAALIAHLEEMQPEAVSQARTDANRLPTIDINRHKPEASAIAVLPAETARLHRVLPIRKVDNRLWVAMENPLDVKAVDAVRMASRCQVIPMRALPEDAFDAAFALAYPENEAVPVENRASENAASELITLVRDLQNEVRELKQEVQGLKRQVAAQQLAPPPPLVDPRPAAYPAPRVFRATPAAQPPFPLFRD